MLPAVCVCVAIHSPRSLTTQSEGAASTPSALQQHFTNWPPGYNKKQRKEGLPWNQNTWHELITSKKVCVRASVLFEVLERTKQQETSYLIKISTIIEKGFWIMNIHWVAWTPFCTSQWQECFSTHKLQRGYVPHSPHYFLCVSSDKVFRFLFIKYGACCSAAYCMSASFRWSSDCLLWTRQKTHSSYLAREGYKTLMAGCVTSIASPWLPHFRLLNCCSCLDCE